MCALSHHTLTAYVFLTIWSKSKIRYSFLVVVVNVVEFDNYQTNEVYYK
jgi:hypothetical protein